MGLLMYFGGARVGRWNLRVVATDKRRQGVSGPSLVLN